MDKMFKEISILWKQYDNKLKIFFVKGEHEINTITKCDSLLFDKKGISGWEFELDEPIEDEIRVLKYIGNLVDNLCDKYIEDNEFDITTYESVYWKRIKLGKEE